MCTVVVVATPEHDARRRWLVTTAVAEADEDDVFVTRRRVDPATDQLIQITSHGEHSFTRIFNRK